MISDGCGAGGFCSGQGTVLEVRAISCEAVGTGCRRDPLLPLKATRGHGDLLVSAEYLHRYRLWRTHGSRPPLLPLLNPHVSPLSAVQLTQARAKREQGIRV
uniref:Uncharacterized protein n=1 Tax=Knipowitschia caucasica TaxID=637954 RepID=A0AAV2LTA0_KNICA